MQRKQAALPRMSGDRNGRSGRLRPKSLPGYRRWAHSVVSSVNSQTHSSTPRAKQSRREDPSLFPEPCLGGVSRTRGAGFAERPAGATLVP